MSDPFVFSSPAGCGARHTAPPALRAATERVPEGETIDLFELDGIPGFNQDEEQNPPAKSVS